MLQQFSAAFFILHLKTARALSRKRLWSVGIKNNFVPIWNESDNMLVARRQRGTLSDLLHHHFGEYTSGNMCTHACTQHSPEWVGKSDKTPDILTTFSYFINDQSRLKGRSQRETSWLNWIFSTIMNKLDQYLHTSKHTQCGRCPRIVGVEVL